MVKVMTHSSLDPPPPALRARSVTQLIGVVPALLGFHPTESLVAIAVHGPRQRLGFRLRIDLPDLEHAAPAAEQVATHLVRQQPDGVILVAFAQSAATADVLIEQIIERLDQAAVDVAEAVRCDGNRFWSYVCDRRDCCPPGGRPYESDSNTLLAEAIYRGVEVLPDRQALVDRFASTAGSRREAMLEATGSAHAKLQLAARGSANPQRDADLVRAGLDKVLGIVDGCRAGRVITDEQVATLSVLATLVVVRDVLWARITRENAAEQLALWRDVAVRTVSPFEPAMFSLAAFAAWLSGDGSQAQCALDRAAQADPDYSMAALLQSALSGGLSPQAWEGLDDGEILRTVPGLT